MALQAPAPPWRIPETPWGNSFGGTPASFGAAFIGTWGARGAHDDTLEIYGGAPTILETFMAFG